MILSVGGKFLKVEAFGPNVVRIACSKHRSFFCKSSLVVLSRRTKARSAVERTAREAVFRTAKLEVRVDLKSGAVTFLDADGNTILAERPHGRKINPAQVQGERTFHVQQQWEANTDESLYGLGQLQLGILDIKGYDLDLWQRNGNVVIPFLTSSRGYGILWDNTSFTRFGDLRPFEPIPQGCLRDGSNELVPTLTGEHQLQTYSNGGIKLWLDDKLLINHWRQNWLADYDQVKVYLEANRRYRLLIEAGGEQATTMQLRWKTPAPDDCTSLWSEVGEGINYYFVYGPELDKVIGGYRQLTGRATLLPKWAFGLWQSRQRYETASQSLEVVDEFRRRGMPFDNIVQDWLYWPKDAWGSHRFDPERFPDPDGWIRAIHRRHAHLMISVWGKYYPGTANFEAMQKAGFLYQLNLREDIRDWVGYPYTAYDAFSAAARKLFWSQINKALFRRGIDAWWMDATEPELTAAPQTLEGQRTHMHPTAMGTGSRMLNAYPLMNSRGVYEGQRRAARDQRVFILTRSGYAGIQRYASATWSGDITSTWTAFAKQIPAGLGFSISGVPYWSMDIGGYAMPSRFSTKEPTPEDAEEWAELNTRWFQFGTFVPLLRLHGELRPREPWTFGKQAYKAMLRFDQLRYRLLPYIYSLAGAVTHGGGTILRPLVMDFPGDVIARRVLDQYMFGPALLVAPVTEYKARRRPVYLPEGAEWYDFWTGIMLAGGKTVDSPAPYDSMPLYVKAGSIIPFGPALQYTDEKPVDPITLYVYAGADGVVMLYEDDGVTYGYERQKFTRIQIHWSDAAKTLTIGKREGSFPGMLAKRTFKVVLISPSKPVGFTFEPRADQTVRYRGAKVELAF
jgi:alpha-D-xyloside xylohydrolase